MWFDLLAPEEHLARVCLGQTGVEGWTGIAFLDNSFVLWIITPISIISEPVLDIHKNYLGLLMDFVMRHMEVSNG